MRCERKHSKMMRFVVLVCVLAASTAASPLSAVGTEDAEVGQFPYQVSVTTSGRHLCGGTILNNRWILTAASCLLYWPVSYLKVAVGTIQLNDSSALVYDVNVTIVHERYSKINFTNDVALINVAKNIEFNANVQPIELETEDIGGDVPVTLSFWPPASSPDDELRKLKWITQKTITVEECQDQHYLDSIVSSQICTLASCQKDYGSPLVRDGKLCGVVSLSVPCGYQIPDVFSRVSCYVDWIQSKINN